MYELYQNFMAELTPQMWQMVIKSTRETIYMGLISTLLAVVAGLPLGFLAFLTGHGIPKRNINANDVNIKITLH